MHWQPVQNRCLHCIVEILHSFMFICAGSLCDYVGRKLSTVTGGCNTVQPVYRPLKALSLNSMTLSRANFDGTDLTRIHLTGADLRRTSLQRAVLRHSRLSSAQIGRAELCRGADFSFSNSQDAVVPDGVLGVLAATRYALVGTSPDSAGQSELLFSTTGPVESIRQHSTLICDRSGNVVLVDRGKLSVL